jgi:hypothetical protein
MKTKYTKKQIKKAITASNSICDILRYLNLKIYAGNHTYITKIIKHYQLDISHFNRKKTLPVHNFITEDILVSNYLVKDSTLKTNTIKKKLIQFGLKERKCENCKITEWKGVPINMELHHKNRIPSDHRLENLEILCPNCHTIKHVSSVIYKKKENVKSPRTLPLIECIHCKKQIKQKTPSTKYCSKDCMYRSKKKQEIKRRLCNGCSKEFIPDRDATIYCSHSCYIKTREKIEWPTKEELEKLVWEKPTTIIAKDLGVSDKAVTKRCKKYKINKPPRWYWSKIVARGGLEPPNS